MLVLAALWSSSDTQPFLTRHRPKQLPQVDSSREKEDRHGHHQVDGLVSPFNSPPSLHALLAGLPSLRSLLVSCGGLGEETIKVWQELDALSAITSALEAHSVFEGGGDEDVLPAMLFGLATPLLTHSQQQQRARQQQQQQRAANPAQPPAEPTEGTEAAAATAAADATPSKKEDAGAAAAAAATSAVDEEADKASRAARLRLAEAFLRLLAERREWVARSLAMAANASPTDLSGGQAAPAPVTINNLLVNSLAHADLLGAFTRQTPVRLRALAVAAARKCEADGTFAPGFAPQLVRFEIVLPSAH